MKVTASLKEWVCVCEREIEKERERERDRQTDTDQPRDHRYKGWQNIQQE
jgi:hypothetical protein